MQTELNYLNIDPRAYKYIRETAVQSIYDALIELITNSVDAYKNPAFNPIHTKYINLHVDSENNILKVIDNAIGMNGMAMNMYFMNVGMYTSTSSDSRGYFSRGAKDLCAIGNVTFTAILGGKISQCYINTNGQGMMVHIDEDVTEEQRALYQIPNNGLHAEIHLKETFNMDIENVATLLPKHYALRDIISSHEFNIYLHVDDEEPFKLDYVYPSGTKIIDMNFDLSAYGYPEADVHFELYKSDEPLEDLSNDTGSDKFNDFGLLISGVNAIHDNSTLHHNIRFNPNMTRLYGRIDCKYINDLMYQIDTDESTYNSTLNPYPIIKPSRQDGLDDKHPFTKALYDIPYKRVLFVLNEMEQIDENYVIQSTDLNQLLSKVVIYGNEVVNTLDNSYTNFVVVDRLARHIANDVEKANVVEDDNLNFSQKNIEKNVILNSNGDLEVKPKFQIKFSEDLETYKYLFYKDINSMVLKISTQHSGLKNYLNVNNGEIEGLNLKEVRIMLSDIIIEALARIILENEVETSPSYTNEPIKQSFRRFELIVNKIEPQIYAALGFNSNDFITQ